MIIICKIIYIYKEKFITLLSPNEKYLKVLYIKSEYIIPASPNCVPVLSSHRKRTENRQRSVSHLALTSAHIPFRFPAGSYKRTLAFRRTAVLLIYIFSHKSPFCPLL